MPINPNAVFALEGPGDLAQQQAQALKYEVVRDERKQLRQRRVDDAAMRRAVQDAQGDPDKAVEMLMRGGFADAAATLQKNIDSSRKAKVEADKAMWTQFSQLGSQVTPRNYAQFYQMVNQADPRLGQMLDPEYSDEGMLRFNGMMVEAGKRMEEERLRTQHTDTMAMRGAELDETARGHSLTAGTAAKRLEFDEKKLAQGGDASEGSDYGRFEADFIAAEAAKRGKAPDALSPTERVSIKTAARKQFGQADDRVIIAGGGGGGLSPGMESNVVNRLTTQWTTANKPKVELDRQVALMDVGMAAARRGDRAPGYQTVLVTFQKILDPPSVVRESEYDRSAAGQSLKNRVQGYLEQLQSGGVGMPISELEKFARLAREAAAAQNTGYINSVKERLGRTADRYKIPRDIVFENVADASPSPAGGGGPTPTLRFNPLTGKAEPIK